PAAEGQRVLIIESKERQTLGNAGEVERVRDGRVVQGISLDARRRPSQYYREQRVNLPQVPGVELGFIDRRNQTQHVLRPGHENNAAAVIAFDPILEQVLLVLLQLRPIGIEAD